MEPLVSVIVPIYNVEKYLKKCVDSIINQTLTNIEIILVDDGSTDNCGKIIDEYAKSDKRVIAIHKENGGQASARNRGLDIASGKYIGFVDSDDWIELDMYESLYRAIKYTNSDISICGRRSYTEEDDLSNEINLHDEVIDFNNKYDKKNILSKFFYNYTVVVWNKLYKKAIINDNHIRFEDVDYVGSEDALFNYCVLSNVRRITSIGGIYYNQLSREDSTARTYKPGYMNRTANMIKCMSDYSKKINDSIVYNDLVPSFLLFYYQWNMSNIKSVKNKNIDQIILKEITDASFNKEFMECVRRLAFDRGLNSNIKKMGFSSSGIIYIRLIMASYYFKLYKLTTKTIMLK